MPAKSARQQHFMGACYGAAKAGHPRKGCPSAKVAREFARKPRGGYRKRR
jgi:hypothetical protein